MKKYFLKLTLFLALIVVALSGALFLLPDDTSNVYLLGALPEKHKMLESTPSPRIIFCGGSNLIMGLDSKQVQDSLNLPVVNAGFHGGMGLRFLINDLQPYVRKGDIIVLSPEYFSFYNYQHFNGGVELVNVVFDIFPAGKKYITLDQWAYVSRYIPLYATSKIKNNLLTLAKPNRGEAMNNGPYGRHSFNQYGDSYIHWTMDPIPFESYAVCSGKEKVYTEVVEYIGEFRDYVASKGARFLILPPVIEDISFQHQKPLIDKITRTMKDFDLPLMASSDRYALPRDCFFDFPYHCNFKGVQKRTALVIEDLHAFLQKSDSVGVDRK
jgi:hypothetical protein